MIRLIAIDMDGTLLSPDHSISELNKKAIHAAKAQGIEVVIATGRSYEEAVEPVSSEGLDLSYICINGAEVKDQAGHLVSATYIEEDDIEKIVSILTAHEIDYQVFVDKVVYIKDIQDQIDTFVQLAEEKKLTPNIPEIRQEVEDRIARGVIQVVDSFDAVFKKHHASTYKIFGTSFNRENLDIARVALEELQGLAVSSSGAGNLEITNINAQKGIALTKLAEARGIPMNKVMAIGDNYNDLSMMQSAGRAVAMGNAPEAIKAACHYVTEENSNSGVGRAIQQVLQQKQTQ